MDAYIVVFSTNDRRSFDVAVDTLQQLRQEYATDKAIILVANKIDLVRKRQVSVDGKAGSKVKVKGKLPTLISKFNEEAYCHMDRFGSIFFFCQKWLTDRGFPFYCPSDGPYAVQLGSNLQTKDDP